MKRPTIFTLVLISLNFACVTSAGPKNFQTLTKEVKIAEINNPNAIQKLLSADFQTKAHQLLSTFNEWGNELKYAHHTDRYLIPRTEASYVNAVLKMTSDLVAKLTKDLEPKDLDSIPTSEYIKVIPAMRRTPKTIMIEDVKAALDLLMSCDLSDDEKVELIDSLCPVIEKLLKSPIQGQNTLDELRQKFKQLWDAWNLVNAIEIQLQALIKMNKGQFQQNKPEFQQFMGICLFTVSHEEFDVELSMDRFIIFLITHFTFMENIELQYKHFTKIYDTYSNRIAKPHILSYDEFDFLYNTLKWMLCNEGCPDSWLLRHLLDWFQHNYLLDSRWVDAFPQRLEIERLIIIRQFGSPRATSKPDTADGVPTFPISRFLFYPEDTHRFTYSHLIDFVKAQGSSWTRHNKDITRHLLIIAAVMMRLQSQHIPVDYTGIKLMCDTIPKRLMEHPELKKAHDAIVAQIPVTTTA